MDCYDIVGGVGIGGWCGDGVNATAPMWGYNDGMDSGMG